MRLDDGLRVERSPSLFGDQVSRKRWLRVNVWQRCPPMLPDHTIVIYERNQADQTFGWGVVFSDATLGHLAAADPESHAQITAEFARWDGSDHGSLGDWRDGRNALESLAVEMVPQIGLVLAWLPRHADEP